MTRAGIVEAAVAILREEGLERATMRRLASELDTGPASLYVYVRNVTELHAAVLDHLLRDVDLSADAGAGWRERLVELLTSYTAVLTAHPSLARSVQALRPTEPNYLHLIDAVLALLDTGGVPARKSAWGVDLLLAQATAIAAEQGTRQESVEAFEEETLAALVDQLSAQDYPNISRVADDILSGTGEQRTRWAITTLIDGIAATAAPPSDEPASTP